MRELLLSIICCCSSLYATAQCNAIITPLGPTSFCQGGSVTLQASNGYVYKWYLNGNLIAVLVSNTLTVSAAGTYTMIIESTGCTDTSAPLIVTHPTVQATITPLSATTICSWDSVKLVGSSGDSYQWYLNGSPISGANDDTLAASTGGDYTVEIDSNGCIGTSGTETVAVNPVPTQPGPISGPAVTCRSESETFFVAPVPGATGYVWWGMEASADTTLVPAVTGTIIVPAVSGSNVLGVRAINSCGSSEATWHPITIYGRPFLDGHYPGERDIADMGGRVCPGYPYVLFAYAQASLESPNTAPYTYQWCLNGVPLPGETNKEYTITHGGNYSVQLITQGCGTLTIPKKVYQDVPNSITIAPSGPLSFCIGDATPLTISFDTAGVSDAIHWTWNYLPYHNIPGVPGDTYSILPNRSGNYNVTSSSGFHPYGGCVVTSNYVPVTIPPPLEVTQINDTLFATPGYASYQWFESGSPIAGAIAQKHVLTVDGDYTVEGIFSNGCIETSDTIDPNYIIPPGNNNTNQNQVQKSINVYPNPSIGAFTVTALVPIEDKTANITITDMTGRVLFTKVAEVKDGVVKEEIDMPDNISRLCVLKVRSKGASSTTSFLKK
jgi:hypothetical protein